SSTSSRCVRPPKLSCAPATLPVCAPGGNSASGRAVTVVLSQLLRLSMRCCANGRPNSSATGYMSAIATASTARTGAMLRSQRVRPLTLVVDASERLPDLGGQLEEALGLAGLDRARVRQVDVDDLADAAGT